MPRISKENAATFPARLRTRRADPADGKECAMTFLEALILGLVQGAGEFLPVSSSGHLLLLEKLGVGEESLFFNICLHLGTLAAVLVAMRKKIFALFTRENRGTLLYILLACIPTAGLALVFKYALPDLVGGAYLPLGFMTTAVVLFASEKLCTAKLRPLDAKSCFVSGVFQGIAVLPGISRSGATIAALRFCGVEKSAAAEFSFLLSVPVILGSALYEGTELALTGGLGGVDPVPLLVGVAAAFLSGLAAIRFFLSVVAKKSTLPFALYTAALSVVSFFLLYSPA